jgi:hypothetical protein
MKAETSSFRHGSPESRLQGCRNPCSLGEFAILGRWIPTSLIGMTLLFFLFDGCELLHAIALQQILGSY